MGDARDRGASFVAAIALFRSSAGRSCRTRTTKDGRHRQGARRLDARCDARPRARGLRAVAALPGGRVHVRDDREWVQRAGERGGGVRQADAEGSAAALAAGDAARLPPRPGSLPGAEVSVLEAGGFGGAYKPIQIYVKGDQIDELSRISNEVLAIVRRTPGAIEGSRGSVERPEVRVDVRRDLASELGVGVGAIARTLRPLLAGERARRGRTRPASSTT